MQRILIIILIFFITGCNTTSKVRTANLILENNEDVFILSILIHDHLTRTNGRDINLNELMQHDTLKRISNNFEKLALKPRGGYIAVYYKFSKSRNNNIELTHQERDVMNSIRRDVNKFNEQYDGEIQFNYGERFYHIKKIVVKKDSTVANSE